MNEELIINSFIEALMETFDVENNERNKRELEVILRKEFFKNGEIIHPEIDFILRLFEKLQSEEDFYSE